MDTQDKIMDIEKKILRTDKMIKKARSVRSLIITTIKNLDDKYTYSTSGFLRGNILGDFIRKSRVKSVNSNIDKVQDAMFKLEADLIIYDKDLAGALRLPAKMSQYGGADGLFSDIALRSNMRLKQFDVTKSLRNVETVIKRLKARKDRLRYDLKKNKELLEYK